MQRLVIYKKQEIGQVVGWTKSIFTWVLKIDSRIVDIILIASYFTMKRKIVSQSVTIYNAHSSLSSTGYKFRINANEVRVTEPTYFSFYLYLNGKYIDPASQIRPIMPPELRPQLLATDRSVQLHQPLNRGEQEKIESNEISFYRKDLLERVKR